MIGYRQVSFGLIALWTLGGCGEVDMSPELEDEPLATQQEEIHGSLRFDSSCSASERVKITEAVEYARDTVDSSDYRDCVRDGVVIDDDGRMAEEIIALSRTSLDVQFYCRDPNLHPCAGGNSWAGCAGAIGGGDPESMALSHGAIADYTPEHLAGTIVHEILHNHRFWHPHYVGFAVNDLVGACVWKGDPSGARRSDLVGDVALAHVGGDGGNGFEYRCSENRVATAISVGANPEVTRLRLGCSIEDSGTLSNRQTVGSSLPSGSYGLTRACPSDYVLVGLKGYADNLVRMVSPVCAPLAAMKDGSSFRYWQGGSVGTSTGRWFTRVCPEGKAVVGLRGKQGALLDRVELVCDEVHAMSTPPIALTPSAGGSGGTVFTPRMCGGHSVMTGLFGLTDPDFAVESLGGLCNRFVGGQVVAGKPLGDGRINAVGTAHDGIRGAAVCDEGDVLVGVKGRATTVVREIHAVCAQPDDWYPRGASGTTYERNGPHTGNAGSPFELRCPMGKAAVGYEGRHGAALDGIRLRCAEPQPLVTPNTSLAHAGGKGGTARQLACPNGHFTGLSLGTKEGDLVSLGAQCGRVVGNRILPSLATGQNQYGGEQDTVLPQMCGANQALVGIRGYENGIVRGLGAVCQTIQYVKAHRPWGTTRLPIIGESVGTSFSRMCPAGEVVQRIVARSGALVDSVMVECGAPDLVRGDTYSGTLVDGQRMTIRIALPDDEPSMRVRMTPPSGADFDLYLRRGLESTNATADVSGMLGGSQVEDLEYPTTNGVVHGDYYIAVVESYDGAGTFTLEVL